MEKLSLMYPETSELCTTQKDSKKAEQILANAVKVSNTNLELAHPHTVVCQIECLNDLVGYYCEQEKYDDAEPLVMDVLQVCSWLLEESQLSQEQCQAIVDSCENAKHLYLYLYLYERDERERQIIESLYQEVLQRQKDQRIEEL